MVSENTHDTENDGEEIKRDQKEAIKENETSRRKHGNKKKHGDETKKYDFPAKLKRVVSCNQIFEEYLKQRRVEGLKAQSESLLKHMCGIRSKLNVDEYIKKSLGRGQLNLNWDEKYDDTINALDDKEDAESYTSEIFKDHGDNIEKRHMRRIKAKVGMFLNVHWYYSQNISYIVPRCTAEQYFPIYVHNLKNALEKFETTLPILLYYLANYMRPACLPILVPPRGADMVDPTKLPKNKSKHGFVTHKERSGITLEDSKKNFGKNIKRNRDNTHKCGPRNKKNIKKTTKVRSRKRHVQKFRIGDLKAEVKEWKRTSSKMNKVTYRKCIVKCARPKPFYATIPLGKKGPEFGAIADQNLTLFNYDSEGSLDADHFPKQTNKPHRYDFNASEIDLTSSEKCDVDDEEIVEDEVPMKKEIKPRTNGLIKAIFNECLDAMKKEKSEKVADLSKSPVNDEKKIHVEETPTVVETKQTEDVPEIEL